MVSAASPTALNGAIRQARDAGILVVVFDISRDGVVRLGGRDERMADGWDTGGGRGRARPVVNLLEIRELAGSFVDEEIHAGITEALKSHPEPTMVFSMHGNWTQTLAREVDGVLPSLQELAAVVTQGGYGAAQAFRAAGRSIPPILLGSQEDKLT